MEKLLKELQYICSKEHITLDEVFQQLFLDKKLSYENLLLEIQSYINKEKEKEYVKNTIKMKKIITKYGYTKATCVADNFPNIITKDKEYKIVCAESLSVGTGDSFLFDNNNKLVRIANIWLHHNNSDAVRVICNKSKFNIFNVIYCNYTQKEFNSLVVNYDENEVYYN